MTRLPLFALSFLLAIAGSVWAPSAFAQLGAYSPTKPTVSPWMNMFQGQGGTLGNYQSYVRPQVQLQKTLAQQNETVQQQDVDVQALGQQLKLTEGQAKAPIQPTGTGSVFMNYSHYYPSTGGPVRHRR